jgi:membrane protease YdiL (CAAX protease family)
MIEFFLKITPAMILAVALFLFLRKAHPLFHLVIFTTYFIFGRDAMTALGLWSLGDEGFLWIRWSDDPMALLLLGTTSIGIVILMQAISPDLGKLIKWFEGNKLIGSLVGIAGAVVIFLPWIFIYRGVPIESRGGLVPLSVLPFILWVCLAGNLNEEVLFRGYLYGWLTEKEEIKPVVAAVITGVFFAFGHTFLAYNVTDVGISVLIYALWEGVIAGLVRSKYGVIPATLTHGLAVFLLTSGLF